MEKIEGNLTNLQGFNDIWSYWMASFTAFNWSQEQVEKILTQFVEKSQLLREETKKVFEDTGRQVRENQAQVQKVITGNFETILSQWGLITKTQQEEMQKKLDELLTKFASPRN